uniref:Apolipoprotein B n=1 Tax=Myotis myotis TaxID=51298 RepID=A0A7J7U421_MYOMY|nr:apolipoprotein B [Myotis myotis]
MFVYEAKGTFTHRDISVEYKEDAKLQEYPDWKVEVRLDITSPVFTDVHIHCHAHENVFYSAASPAIGTVVLDLGSDNTTITYNFYYRPQSSPDKNLSIFKIEHRHPYSESNEKFQIKVNWEKESVSQLLSSLKDNVPKATGALYNYVNKCHQEYTGLNLREASLKLRRGLQNKAEETYQGALILIDKVDKTLEFKRVARGAARTYQLWNDKVQILYKDLLDQEGHIDLQRLQNKLTRFQLPGRASTNTADELSTLVMRGVGKILLQVHSNIHNGLEILLSYVQDLMEKSELIKDLKIKFPFDSRTLKLTNVTLEYGKQLNSFSQMVQRVLNALKSNKTTVILGDLQRYLEGVFEYIREEVNHLKMKRLTVIIKNIKHEIKLIFDSCIQYVSQFLKENLDLDFDKLDELVQNKFQEASEELEQLHRYIKALRKEYLDSSVVSWTLKYYEFEEKVINLVKKLVHALKYFHSKYIVNAADIASQLSSEAEQLVQQAIQKSLSILADADGKGKEKIVELFTSAQEIIKSWTAAMKEIISDYHQQFKYILQNFSDRLFLYYENFIAESLRLIDLSIQTYHMFLIYITGLLKQLQSTTVYDLSRYLKIAPGELTITF